MPVLSKNVNVYSKAITKLKSESNRQEYSLSFFRYVNRHSYESNIIRSGSLSIENDNSYLILLKSRHPAKLEFNIDDFYIERENI